MKIFLSFLGCLIVFTILKASPKLEIPKIPNQKRIIVQPIIFIPADVTLSRPDLIKAKSRISKHLNLAISHYLKILKIDTFKWAESDIRTYTSPNPNSYYSNFNTTEAYKTAGLIVGELFSYFNTDRYLSNQIFLVIYVRPKDKPYNGKFNMFGGGRTFNGLPNTGGGYVEMEFDSLMKDQPYPFQSTLVHELGHAFGLTHVDCLGYDMETSISIMSYNLSHHSTGLTISESQGFLHPEELKLLSLNKKVFPDLNFDPVIHNPDHKSLTNLQKCFLGPMGKEIGIFKHLPGVGYELFFNSQRVNGPEAAFYSFYQAEQNCKWNQENRKQTKVECRYNGILFQPGEAMINDDGWQNKIRFLSDIQDNKFDAIKSVSRAIKKAALFLNREGLSGNLKDYLKDLTVTIHEHPDYFIIDLGPISNEGHDFNFKIDKKTNSVDENSLVIGEVLPEPDI